MAQRRTVLAGLLAAPLIQRSAKADATPLQLWHDLGDPGTKWFAEVAAAFAPQSPGFQLRATSFPTDQWFGRSIGAINTGAPPDLLFNNYERVIRVSTQTGRVADLRPLLDRVSDHAFLSPGDLRVATYGGRMLILPVQRVQMAFGVRRSWLQRAGETFPATWDDLRRVGGKFQAQGAEGGGRVFALALQAAKPRDLIHMLDLFTFGAGLQHTLVDPDGQVTVDDPKHAAVLVDFLRAFTTDRLVAPDTINYSFNEMYQTIEGGRAGMFRVGDWNVAKWDGPTSLKGDFEVGAWPAPDKGGSTDVVVGGMRGVAVPENAPQRELAERFAVFLLGQQAQQASLRLMGSAVRRDLDIDGLSDRQKQFARADWPLNAYDFPEASLAWYPEFETGAHRRLVAAIASPPGDWAGFVAPFAAGLREDAKALAARK